MGSATVSGTCFDYILLLISILLTDVISFVDGSGFFYSTFVGFFYSTFGLTYTFGSTFVGTEGLCSIDLFWPDEGIVAGWDGFTGWVGCVC